MAQDIFLFTFILIGVTALSLIIIKNQGVDEKPSAPLWDSCYEKSEEIEYSETQKALHTLLNKLEAIGKVYGEIYDTECCEQMSEAVFNAFVFQYQDYHLPQRFGLYHDDGNKAVYLALDRYINRVSDLAKGLEISNAKERMHLLQDEVVYTNEEQTVDNFFIWVDTL